MVGVYLRISDDREGRRLGVQRQRDDTTAKCHAEGDTVVDYYIDNDISASAKAKKDRPEYKRLIADAQSGRITKIVAYTTGRLTRKPREHEDLIDLSTNHGIVYGYVSSPALDLNTAHGRRVARYLAVGDAGEAEDIAERVQRAKQQAAEQGKYRGGPRRFGYEKDGITVIPAEIKLLREMAQRVLAGESYRSIAADLNARGILTTRGKQWDGTRIRLTLDKPSNASIIELPSGEEVPALWQPALHADRDEAYRMWRSIRSLTTDPTRRSTLSTERRWLGTNLYLCGRCNDGTRIGSPAPQGNGRMGYRCRQFNHLVIEAEKTDAVVERLVVARLQRADAVELLRGDDGVDTAALRRESADIREQLRELAKLFARRVLSADQLEAGSSELNAALADVERRLSAASSAPHVLGGIAGNPELPFLWYGREDDRSDGLALSRRRAVVDAVLVVTILPGQGPRVFRPERVRPDWR